MLKFIIVLSTVLFASRTQEVIKAKTVELEKYGDTDKLIEQIRENFIFLMHEYKKKILDEILLRMHLHDVYVTLITRESKHTNISECLKELDDLNKTADTVLRNTVKCFDNSIETVVDCGERFIQGFSKAFDRLNSIRHEVASCVNNIVSTVHSIEAMLCTMAAERKARSSSLGFIPELEINKLKSMLVNLPLSVNICQTINGVDTLRLEWSEATMKFKSCIQQKSDE